MMRKSARHRSAAARADELFKQQQHEIYLKTDQLFAKLMFWQWLACVSMAIIISPYTWNGETRAIHIHVWAAIFLGGAISLFPIWLTRAWPGAAITRYVIGVAQMLMSALLISVTGGRIETHFHVFGSLVILSFYRDWRVLIPATIVVALDHFVRGIYWPYSVYGVLTASPLRSIEHAAWVVFEDVFLVISCLRSIGEMRAIANRTAALETSEQNFRDIFQKAPIGMAVVGLDETFLQANAKLREMVGYSEEELLQRTPLDITHPDDIGLSRKLAREMLHEVSHNQVEKRYLRKDGEIVWAARTASVVRDETGNPRHFLIMIEDISERKRAEEALQERTQELETAVTANQSIMDNSLDVICTIDEEGRFLTVNAACEQLWGYAPAELIGKRYIDFVAPDDRERTLATQSALTTSGKVTDFVNRYVRKDGRTVDVLWSATWSEENRIFFGVAHDISDRRRAEEEIQSLNQSLEQRVAERTAELQQEVTERLRAEESLVASEERYRTLFDRNPEPMWVFDVETLAFLEVNQAAVEHYGYSRSEFLGMTLKQIRPDEDVPALLVDIERLQAGAGANQQVWKHRKKDGTIIDVAIIANDFDWNGRPARLVLAIDVTERKRAEEALGAAEQKYRAIFENSIEGIFQSTPQGKWISVNPALSRMYGCKSPAEMMNRDVSPLFVDPARRAEFKQLMEQQSFVEGFEFEIYRNDRSTMWLSETSRAVRDENGSVICYEGAVQDITERKHAEKALRQAERKYRAIFENAIEGIFQTTPGGKYISVNPALARIYGYNSPEELMASVADIGQTIYVDPKRRLEFKALIEAHGFVELFEYEVYRKDGSKILLCENARAVRDANGAVTYYEGTVVDVTQIKRVEEIERANKAKSEFLSRVSHELRTPLNAILGFGQLLERQKPTEKQRPRIRHILNAGQHLLGLINEVLDISRIEAGKMQVSLEPVSVANSLAEAIDLMRPLASERKINLSADSDLDAAVHVLADRQRFKQVLLNLLTNAIKYTPGSGNVTVSYRINGKKNVYVSVSDTGPGIPQQKLPRLFTPFERLGAEQSNVEGTGLGLALCQRLMQAMHGSIGVGTAVGKGSTFWIELAWAESPLNQISVRRRDLPAPRMPSNSARRKVLYIEDNLSNLTLVEQMIEELPEIELITAMQGQVGLDLARKHSPDLILLDLHLPDLPGWKIISQLKAGKNTRDIPVIIISADATKRQIDRLMSAGATAYLTKPLDMNEFFRALEMTITPKRNDNSETAAAVAGETEGVRV